MKCYYFVRCGDGTCVAISVLCDHHQDCEDNSDEDCCMFLLCIYFIFYVSYQLAALSDHLQLTYTKGMYIHGDSDQN